MRFRLIVREPQLWPGLVVFGWVTLVARRRARLPYADARDALIAATALEHGLTLVTRNVSAFKAGKVKVFNPWGYRPEPAEEDADWRQVARTGPMWLRNLFIRS